MGHRVTGIHPDQIDLAVVILVKARPVRDVEHCRVVEVGSKKAHQPSLADLVESRGRLVHNGDVGRADEEPSEGEPLLLTAGEDDRPLVLLMQPRDEVRQTAPS